MLLMKRCSMGTCIPKAFFNCRNNLPPRKLHLDIALGDYCPKEGESVGGISKELKENRENPGSNHEHAGTLRRANEIARFPAPSTGIVIGNMERLRLIKKHRHGRRTKQLEKVEQKMKEERAKRICERQKEFFGEFDVHGYQIYFCYLHIYCIKF